MLFPFKRSARLFKLSVGLCAINQASLIGLNWHDACERTLFGDIKLTFIPIECNRLWTTTHFVRCRRRLDQIDVQANKHENCQVDTRTACVFLLIDMRFLSTREPSHVEWNTSQLSIIQHKFSPFLANDANYNWLLPTSFFMLCNRNFHRLCVTITSSRTRRSRSQHLIQQLLAPFLCKLIGTVLQL